MKRTATFLKMMLLSMVLAPMAAPAAIFGDDNRHAVTPLSPPAIQQLARSTAIAVLSGLRTFDATTGAVTLDAPPVDGVCSDEAFARDPSLQYSCTGFLIAPDLLVTAGHCVYAVNTPHHERVNEPDLGCKTFDWLFDYESSADGITQTKNIPAEHLYHCSKIIYATQTETAPFLDYALIQLDRPALGRTPLLLSVDPLVVRGPVAMLGYPHGTPVKYTDGGAVILNNAARDSFLTNLDAFEGNSGAPVFNGRKEVVGILISGTPSNDWVHDQNLQCDRVNRCDESGANCALPDTVDFISGLQGYQGVGSEVQRIAPLAELLKKFTMPAH